LLTDLQALKMAAEEGPVPRAEPDEPQKPAYVRSVNEARAVALEVQAPLPAWREQLISPGSGQSMSEAGREFLAPKPRRSVTWYGWKWPLGWQFRPGRHAAGLKVVSALPCQGSVLTLDGVQYQTSWSYTPIGHELMPMPEWLRPLLGKET
jgi:hypothetical protein